ncbi:MAG: NADH-quinone oxidoreductase subunit M [Thermoleophilia bacterium]
MPWTSIAVLLPLAGALILLCIPTTALPAPRFQALLFSGASFVLAVVQLFRIKRGVGTPQFVDHHRWISTVGLEWRVGVDGISIWLLLLTSGLFLVAIAAIAMRPPQRGHLFLGLLLLSEAGLMGLFASQNLLLFYLFWELMLIPFYFLIGIWGEGERVRNTTRFVIYTTAGSFLMLVGIAATGIIAAKVTGQFTLDMESLRGVRFSDTQSVWLFSAFAIAFAIKLPIWPLHGWMPGAYGSAPIVLTALLSAVMSKAGAYGLLRVGVPLYPHGASVLQTPIYLAAIIGIAYGSLVAWRQRSMRMLVAYSSLAHLGFIALGIMSFTNDGAQGAVLQMVNHGLVVAAAFLIVGILAERSGHEDVDDLGGLAQGAPWLGGVFLLVTMASLAVPGSNAFAGEFFILTGVFRHDWWAATLATIGIAYAAVYMLRLYQTTMNGPLHGAEPRRVELRRTDAAVLLPLLAVMGVIALWPNGLLRTTVRTVGHVIAPAQVAAHRPANEIRETPVLNPPTDALPLPGDPAGSDATTQGATTQ